jgi:Zn/Cd-binding protein ZinT
MNLQEDIQRIKSMMGLLTEQTKVLGSVLGPVGKQPISNPDLDLVHGILGSKRIQDDFSERVTQSLKDWNDKGYKTDVSNIKIKTYIKGNDIITESSCDIVESMDGNSYNEFTTRGSIGDDFETRHDGQVDGLVDRLKQFYGGNAKQVGKPFVITFKFNDTNVSYKQSFFVASKDNEEEIKTTIRGNDINDLRTKLKEQTQNISIDPNSITINMDEYKISFNSGNEQIQIMSLIFDDKGQISDRLVMIKSKNPTMKIIEQGKDNNIDWVVVII